MAVWKELLLLLLMVTTACCKMVSDLPGGGNIEVETGSRGEVCMYITDDWGSVESSQCTSTPGTYTLTGRGGGQARVTVSQLGGISVNTGYFRELQPQSGGDSTDTFTIRRQQQKPLTEEEENSIRFGAFEDLRRALPRQSLSERSPPAHEARRLAYRRLRPAPPRRRPTVAPTLPPVRVPHLYHTVRPTFGPLVLPRAPPVTEAGLGAVEIIASGPGQLTVFGDGFGNDGGLEVTGPSATYSTPEGLVARKKRNRLSAASSSGGAATVQSQADTGAFSAVRSEDGSTVLSSHQPGHQLTSVQSSDGDSVLASQQDGDSLSSVQSADGGSVLTSRRGGHQVSAVQSADGGSVITSQTADGQRLGLVRSPDGSLVYSTFIDGRLVNVVRSSDGSSVVSTNVDGRQVTALTSPAGQRLIAGAGPGHNLDAFFNRLMLQLGGP